MLLMNELHEFVDPEPGCAYPSLERIKPRRTIDRKERADYNAVCPTCGGSFRSNHKSKVYCSDHCRNVAYRKRREGR